MKKMRANRKFRYGCRTRDLSLKKVFLDPAKIRATRLEEPVAIVPGLAGLTPDQARTVRAVARGFQTYLESAIDALIVPGTNAGMNADDNAMLNALRKQWRQAEDLQLALETRKRRRSK